ncbi:ATP-binding protein [Candidatus Parabeggiatoa sp. HSG14]|uniref:AAA family ATPase n=1 Tax=Candidatus Parabeggiatoa sp. HSG14 TaxID=3055593 RepID=UPI0025A8BF3B|nr:ATP-binding protein [Thiotrichales bacterium HSG14]
MKFQIEKLGMINKAEIELGNLTIICGKNNTCKTYTSYAIYGFLKTWKDNIKFKLKQDQIENLINDGILKIDLTIFEKDIDSVLEKLSKRYTPFIPKIFSANEDYFSKAKFHALSAGYKINYQNRHIESQLSIGRKNVLKALKEKDKNILEMILLAEDLPPTIVEDFFNRILGETLLDEYFANPFMITSERTGVSLFHRELDISKNVLVERLQEQGKKNLEPSDLFQMLNESVSRYALPIKEEIDFVRDIVDVHSKNKSPLIKKHPELAKLLKDIVGGDYKVEGGQIYFAFRKGRKLQRIPLYIASSAVKSQLDISFYLKHLAKKGDILLVDEPEQNLHPANQRKIARLFVRLIKAGIKILVTTHSDYLIKELNNLIILGNEFEEREKIMKKYHYTEEDVLKPSMVKAYIAEKQTLVSAPINEMGIVVSSFDLEIREMNEMFDDMTMTMEIAYD